MWLNLHVSPCLTYGLDQLLFTIYLLNYCGCLFPKRPWCDTPSVFIPDILFAVLGVSSVYLSTIPPPLP